jgi:hypothetical protein
VTQGNRPGDFYMMGHWPYGVVARKAGVFEALGVPLCARCLRRSLLVVLLLSLSLLLLLLLSSSSSSSSQH